MPPVAAALTLCQPLGQHADSNVVMWQVRLEQAARFVGGISGVSLPPPLLSLPPLALSAFLACAGGRSSHDPIATSKSSALFYVHDDPLRGGAL